MIERKIIIGLISSGEYCKAIIPHYKPEYLESAAAREIAGWVVEYYGKYSKPPRKDIETIFFRKLEEGLQEEIAEEFEEEILPSLSAEYVEDGLDDFLFDETIKHFQEIQYKFYAEELLDTIENDKISKDLKLEKVKNLSGNFSPLTVEEDKSLGLHTEAVREAFKEAFKEQARPVIVFPKELGEFWNEQLIPGGFIGILAPEKRGKSWLLLEIAMRAARQGKKIVMYQAGDMNQAAQLKRIAIYLCRRSTQAKYCGEHLQPVRDCIKNQSNTCIREERECDFGLGVATDDVRRQTISDYKDLVETWTEYSPCYNCAEWQEKKLGVPWFKNVSKTEPIGFEDALTATEEFFEKYKGQFYLDTYANGTLSVKDIEEDLDKKYEKYGFIPDLILVDYADILRADGGQEHRHQQNHIWKGLRRISQTAREDVLPLVIVPTQADGASYRQISLNLNNYSEDKRKYSHVTAFYALNQDPKGREKGIGMLRIAEIMIREGEFSPTNQITVLQDLRIGRPYIAAFWGGENKAPRKVTDSEEEEE